MDLLFCPIMLEQNKSKHKKVRLIYFCTWIFLKESNILSKGASMEGTLCIPFQSSRKRCNYYNILCLDEMVYVSTSTLVYYYAKRLFSMLSLSNIQTSFYFEDLFKSRTSVHLTSNLNPSEDDPFLSSSAFYLWGPMCIFSANQNAVPIIFEKWAILAINHSIHDFLKPPQPLHIRLFLESCQMN